MQVQRRNSRLIRLIDIENLTGSATVSRASAGHVADAVNSVVATSCYDLTVVAASHRNGLAAGLAYPGARLVCKSGPNGADEALATAFADQPHLEGFDGVVIGSGDGFFVAVAEQARARGLQVIVVARSRGLSRQLAAVADVIALLPNDIAVAAEAA